MAASGRPSGGEIKSKVRQLKKLESRLRFGTAAPPFSADMVWDAFFDLKDDKRGRARYPLSVLLTMSREQYRAVVDEFFFSVYYRMYRDNGLNPEGLYDPELLGRFGLPADADEEQVKRKFRELALKLHPDMGGDAEKFIELMENYRKLVEKGR